MRSFAGISERDAADVMGISRWQWKSAMEVGNGSRQWKPAVEAGGGSRDVSRNRRVIEVVCWYPNFFGMWQSLGTLVESAAL